jgi:hypothetical protein
MPSSEPDPHPVIGRKPACSTCYAAPASWLLLAVIALCSTPWRGIFILFNILFCFGICRSLWNLWHIFRRCTVSPEP